MPYVYTGAVFGAGLLGAVGVLVQPEPLYVESNGGYRLDLFVDGLADGDYYVYVGSSGTTSDARCYVYLYREGGDVHGYVTTAKDGWLTVYTPVLTVGGPYKWTLVPIASNVTAGENALSNAAGTVISLSSGAFPIEVVAGLTFRVLSGAAAGLSATILTRNSDTQVTLSGAGLGVFVALAASWEVNKPVGGTVVSLHSLTVERYWYRSKTFAVRRWFPPDWGVGPRRLVGVPLQA